MTDIFYYCGFFLSKWEGLNMVCETYGTNVFQSLGRVRQSYKVFIWISDIDFVFFFSERKREIISKVVSIVDIKFNG